jgi:hypothetical protein
MGTYERSNDLVSLVTTAQGNEAAQPRLGVGKGTPMVLSVVPQALTAFAAANAAAAESISTAGSADSAAMLDAAAAALGPIGASYLAAYGPAQANNLTAALMVGRVHEAIAAATHAASMSFVAADDS